MKRILIVDNQLSHRDLLHKFLSDKGYRIESSSSAEQALKMIGEISFDTVISEYRLADMDGIEFFEKITCSLPQACVIFMSREIVIKNAVDLIRKGAYHFLAKPLHPDELLDTLQDFDRKKATAHAKGANKVVSAVDSDPIPAPAKIVAGISPKAKWMMKQAEKVGGTDFTVLIEGETGTGKESLAWTIHQKSSRNAGPFVAVDCGSLSKEIAGSEFFGHEKGAFTGAVAQKTGFFEQANGGTIFLDEIANLSLDIQVSLLRALQEKVIRKIGGINEIPIDIRIIAATNENLMDKSKSSRFRKDLLFRLNEFVLKVPPLRERKEDLPLFLDFFLESTSRELGRSKPILADDVLTYLEKYHWPGNIREFRNVIRRACLFVDGDNRINIGALPQRILTSCSPSLSNNKSQKTRKMQESRLQEDTDDLKSATIRAESKRIIEVLREVQFNKTRAAEVLNIHRKTLYSKLKLMNIHW